MIREHVSYLHRAVDRQSLPVRGVMTILALLSLPVLGTTARSLNDALGLGRYVLPLLVLAHVPAVIALLAVWSIGCDVCRSEGST
jgi:hypothetical protein